MATTLDLLSDEQRAKVSAVQRALSQINTALAEAGAAGVSIDIDVVDVTALGDRATTYRLGGSVTLPPAQI